MPSVIALGWNKLRIECGLRIGLSSVLLCFVLFDFFFRVQVEWMDVYGYLLKASRFLLGLSFIDFIPNNLHSSAH